MYKDAYKVVSPPELRSKNLAHVQPDTYARNVWVDNEVITPYANKS